MIIQIGDVLVSSEILTEYFCCNLAKCKGACCIEGDAGAPITIDELEQIELNLDKVRHQLSVPAQLVIAAQGVAYNDKDGELVTSIVNGKDCVFTCYQDITLSSDDNKKGGGETVHNSDETVKKCCLCAFEYAFRGGKTKWCKPISCALYPIRESKLSNGLTAIVYHRWDICKDAVKKGQDQNIKIYEFLKAPLTQRFGTEWYEALCIAAKEITATM